MDGKEGIPSHIVHVRMFFLRITSSRTMKLLRFFCADWSRCISYKSSRIWIWVKSFVELKELLIAQPKPILKPALRVKRSLCSRRSVTGSPRLRIERRANSKRSYWHRETGLLRKLLKQHNPWSWPNKQSRFSRHQCARGKFQGYQMRKLWVVFVVVGTFSIRVLHGPSWTNATSVTDLKSHLAKMSDKKGNVKFMRYLKSGLHLSPTGEQVGLRLGNLKDRPRVDQVF